MGSADGRANGVDLSGDFRKAGRNQKAGPGLLTRETVARRYNDGACSG